MAWTLTLTFYPTHWTKRTEMPLIYNICRNFRRLPFDGLEIWLRFSSQWAFYCVYSSHESLELFFCRDLLRFQTNMDEHDPEICDNVNYWKNHSTSCYKFRPQLKAPGAMVPLLSFLKLFTSVIIDTLCM